MPLFLQYWWMETVCRGKMWDVAMALDGETLLGVMPFHYGRKFGRNYLLQPQLTQFSGPFYCYPDGLDECRRLEFEKKTARLLIMQIAQLKPAFVIQHFSPEVTNWLPFHWEGYSQTTRYTYRFDDISDPRALLDKMHCDKNRRKILRNIDSTTVRFDMSPSDFAAFHHRYWLSRGKRDLLGKEFIAHVCSTAVARGNGVIASLHDSEGKLLAARFAVYDSRCAHSLMSASDPDLHRSGHNETLIWRLIEYLSSFTKAYDFEGSMDEGIEYFYRSFGARQVPFFEVSRCDSLLFGLLLKIKKK